MKKKLYNWLFKKAIKIIALNLVRYSNPLTPDYLIKLGWIKRDGYYFEPNVKNCNKIYIRFESYYYNVYYGDKKVHIAMENSLEWFQNYFLLAHNDNGRFELANV